MIKRIFVVFIFALFINNSYAKENIMILKLKDGDVKIELFNDVAPKHVERIIELANSGKYDNVVSGEYKTLKNLKIKSTTIQSILPKYIYRFRTGGQFG